MHKLLARQIRRYCEDPERIPAELMPLLEAVSQAYEQADAERALLERAMDLTSEELSTANEQLRAENAHKQELLHEATEARAMAEEQATELEMQAEELQAQAIHLADAQRELEQANAAKSDFLATMSHELRTPLNAMIGYTDLMKLGVPEPIGPRTLEQVLRIELAARHLLQLIDEVLTFSRLEAGRESADLVTVDLNEVVDEVHAIIKPLAERKGLKFAINGAAPFPDLLSDPRKLRQILINLLGNAVKFTDAGSVELDVVIAGGRAQFAVRDTGIGIEADSLESIFEPFRQLETDRAKRAEGTGLGLSVSRRLARLLGGDLTCTSQRTVGSTFLLDLPAARAAGALAEAEWATAGQS